MKFFFHRWGRTGAVMVGFAAGTCGCAHPDAAMYYRQPSPYPPLGTISDTHWQLQESNAEASKFVVYVHEFTLNDHHLNVRGEDHVKQIAAELLAGSQFPVAVERGFTSPLPDTKYQYPVHQDPDLDLRRRRVVVRALTALGVNDAEQRVVVAPAFAQPYTGVESERSYYRAIYTQGGGGGGFGGGGFGGFGGFR